MKVSLHPAQATPTRARIVGAWQQSNSERNSDQASWGFGRHGLLSAFSLFPFSRQPDLA